MVHHVVSVSESNEPNGFITYCHKNIGFRMIAPKYTTKVTPFGAVVVSDQQGMTFVID